MTALAGSVFVFLTAEMLPVGLLPEMARSMHVEPSRVGSLVGLYAATAAVVGLPVAALCRRWDRRTVLSTCLLLLSAGQFCLAIAPTLEVAVAARMVTASTHVVVWATAPLAAAAMAGPGRAGWATGRVFLGSTGGLLIGVPAMTFLGQQFGWRVAAALLALLALAAAGSVRATLPVGLSQQRANRPGRRQQHPSEQGPPAAPRYAGRGVPGAVVAIVAATTMVVTATFAYYPYLSLFAAGSGIVGTGFAALLTGLGVAGIIGVTLASRWVDGAPRTTAGAFLSIVATAPLLFTGSLHPSMFGVVILSWGLADAAVPVILQAGIIQEAGTQADIASASYVVAYQVGIAAGTWVGATGSDTLLPLTTALVTLGCSLLLLMRRNAAGSLTTTEECPA